MSAHDELKRAGITPTTDAEKAYKLGFAAAITAVAQVRSRQQKPANGGNPWLEWLRQRYN